MIMCFKVSLVVLVLYSVYKWNKYLWLISCLIVWWNLIIEKKLLNFEYILM